MHGGPAGLTPGREPQQVGFVLGHLDEVPRGPGDDPLAGRGAQGLPEPLHVRAQGADGRGGRGFVPYRLGQRTGRDRLARVDQQGGQQHTRPGSRDRADPLPVVDH